MSGSSYGNGRYQAGEDDVQLEPRIRASNRYGIIVCHGATQRALSSKGFGGFAEPLMLAKLCEIGGYPIFAADLGASPYSNWGNDAEGMVRMTTAFNYVTGTLGYRAGKVHLLGFSMGNVVALRWAIQNPTKVASIAAGIPVYDVQAARVNNVTLRSSIDTAWGVTYPAALPVNASPKDNIATIAGVVPWKGWYASDDEADFITGAQDCATALSGTATSLGALGHTDAAIGAIPVADLASFFASHD